MIALALFCLALPQKLALFGFQRGAGVDDAAYHAVIESIAGEVRSVTNAQLITPDEIKTLLSVEEHKQLVGCTAEACFAEIGGALGAERILTGSVGQTGESLMLFIKLVHSRRIGEVKQVSRRFKGGKIDDVLDAIPGAVKELFSGAPPAPPPPAPTTTTLFDREGWVKPRPYADAQNVRQRLRVYADGVGHYLAIEPTTGTSTLVFHGNIGGLSLLRLEGASKNGARVSFGFWDPRFVDGWQRQLVLEGNDATVVCDAKKITYKLLAGKEAAPVLAAPLFQTRVTYGAVALASDPSGVYYYVDRELRAKPAKGYRLFMGMKGKLARIELDDAIVSDQGASFVSAAGRLLVKPAEKTAEWTTPAGTQKLELVNTYMESPMIFTDLGVYPVDLGTPCDEREPHPD
ncbi:MAG: hypothetical protein IT381_05525 [Deltaproteobacteria bacterium]|nr:hypothetical protein [Deltaproteobacteria bacterium]